MFPYKFHINSEILENYSPGIKPSHNFTKENYLKEQFMAHFDNPFETINVTFWRQSEERSDGEKYKTRWF